jgi:hypothetical protein
MSKGWFPLLGQCPSLPHKCAGAENLAVVSRIRMLNEALPPRNFYSLRVSMGLCTSPESRARSCTERSTWQNIFLVNLTTLYKLRRWDIRELLNEKDVKRSSNGLFKVLHQHDFRAGAKPQEICQDNEMKMEHGTSRMRSRALMQRSIDRGGDSKDGIKEDEVLKL